MVKMESTNLQKVNISDLVKASHFRAISREIKTHNDVIFFSHSVDLHLRIGWRLSGNLIIVGKMLIQAMVRMPEFGHDF
jgi:hypothetical protein